PSLGMKNLSDLIARAKGHPDEISCAVTGIGRLTHLTAELLQDQAGIKLLIVPYTGGPAPAISEVARGRVGVVIEGYSGIAGAVQSGSVKHCGCLGETSGRVPRSAYRGRNDPGLFGDRLASLGGTDRHARKDHPQGERRSAQGRHGPGLQEKDRYARQLYASDVAS